MSPSATPASPDSPLAAPDLRHYRPGRSLMAQARALADADAATLAALADAGVPAVLARDLGRALDIAPRRFFRELLGTNRSAAEKKSFTDAPLPAAAGRIALELLRLLGRLEALRGGGPAFDAARWLGRWIEQPHPCLGGRCPMALLTTPHGAEAALRLIDEEGGGNTP